jgi:hypothetical protein
VREALRLELKKRGCGLLLLRCVGDFPGCGAGVSVRRGITPSPGLFLGLYVHRARVTCTIFEEALVARAEGIWAIALDVEWPTLSVELT